jgi:DNA-directed RNA polymerase subunit alpha
MSTIVADLDFDKLLEAESITRETVTYIKDQVYSAIENREAFDKKAEALKAELSKTRDSAKQKDLTLLVGICDWIAGRSKGASDLLKEVKSRKIGAYYLGKCCQETGDYKQALECFERAMRTDAEDFEVSMDIAETKRMAGDPDGALGAVKRFSQTHDNNAEFHYQFAHCLDDLGMYSEAFSHYERALQINPEHAGALFRMAFNYDMDGDEDMAIEYYERCVKLKPAYKNAVINLGLLYEDKGEFDDAVYCYESVLDAEPINDRASLFLKDAKESLSMYYDEEVSKRQGKESEVLNIPISDFELSVRSKNCLERMNIHTLKDLTRITEADLLSFKNFGETSLNEIKLVLAQKGLRLGQALENGEESEIFANESDLVGESTMTSDIGLSTRCKNALWKIGIETVDDLVKKTENELLQQGVKQNYIDEAKECLAKLGRSLQTNEEGELGQEEDGEEQ